MKFVVPRADEMMPDMVCHPGRAVVSGPQRLPRPGQDDMNTDERNEEVNSEGEAVGQNQEAEGRGSAEEDEEGENPWDQSPDMPGVPFTFTIVKGGQAVHVQADAGARARAARRRLCTVSDVCFASHRLQRHERAVRHARA